MNTKSPLFLSLLIICLGCMSTNDPDKFTFSQDKLLERQDSYVDSLYTAAKAIINDSNKQNLCANSASLTSFFVNLQLCAEAANVLSHCSSDLKDSLILNQLKFMLSDYSDTTYLLNNQKLCLESPSENFADYQYIISFYTNELAIYGYDKVAKRRQQGIYSSIVIPDELFSSLEGISLSEIFFPCTSYDAIVKARSNESSFDVLIPLESK